MGAHLIDFPFWALDLGMPTSVETISTPFNNICFPNATTTYYEFAARNGKPAVKLTWYDGGMLPPRPAEFSEEMVADRNGRMVYKDQVDPGGGVMFIGNKGKLMHETYGYKPRLLPQSLHESYGTPKQTLPRIQTTHEMNWVEAAKGNAQASARSRTPRGSSRSCCSASSRCGRRRRSTTTRRTCASPTRSTPTTSSAANTAAPGS
jgi:hypothetical protein